MKLQIKNPAQTKSLQFKQDTKESDTFENTTHRVGCAALQASLFLLVEEG